MIHTTMQYKNNTVKYGMLQALPTRPILPRLPWVAERLDEK